MKALFSTSLPGNYFHVSMLTARLIAGSFMLTHGIPKLGRLTSGEEIKFADPFGLGSAPSLILVVFAEVFCSCCVILGLGTRIAPAILIFTMLVAAFHAHGDDPFATKEKALLFAAIYFLLIVFGSGKNSIDRFIGRQ